MKSEYPRKALEYLSMLQPIEAWAELEERLNEATAHNSPIWELPIVGAKALGEFEEQSLIPAVALLACLQLSIMNVDDLLDEDPRGVHHKYGIGASANMAAGYQSLGLQAIFESSLPTETKLEVVRSANRMMYQTAYGQYLDANSPQTEEGYWEIVRTKSSPFYSLTLEIGGLCAGGTLLEAEKLKHTGELYGEMIQIHDDLRDVMDTPANPDWLQERYPLPILFATLVKHPDRERFIELRARITEEEALKEAQTILIRCGALSYCMEQLVKRYEKSIKLVEESGFANPRVLEELFFNLVEPLVKMLDEIGAPLPESLQDSFGKAPQS